MKRQSMIRSIAGVACAVLAFAVIVTPLTDASAQAVDRPQARSGNEYRLSTGDKITVTVFGQADLSGDYLIDSAGHITMPLAGQIAVGDLTIKESEATIADRFRAGYIRQPTIGVRISELRPIYVVGDVKVPGTYPFRYGSSVLSSIAVAGGYAVMEAAPGAAAAEFLLADERARVLEQTRLALLIRQERVTAQLDSRDTFEPPAFGVPPRLDTMVADTISSERGILAAQVGALRNEIKLQMAQKPIIEQAIAATINQADGERKQLSLVKEQAANYSKLDPLGLSRRVNAIAIEREKAALESSIAKLGADLARLQLLIGEIDIKIQDLEHGYKRRAIAEMQDVRAKLAEIEAALPTARELRELRAQQAGGGLGVDDEASVSRTLFIMRTRNNEVQVLPATTDMLLQPGDIVEVKRLRPRGSRITREPQAALTGSNSSAHAGFTSPTQPTH